MALIIGRQVLKQIKHRAFEAFPLFAQVVAEVRAIRDKNFRKVYGREAAALRRLKKSVGNRFIEGNRAPLNNPVLFFGFSRVDMASVERTIAASFECAGMSPIMLGPRFVHGHKAYRRLGLSRIHTYDPPVKPEHRALAAQAIMDMNHETELHAFTHAGVPCGKFAISTLMREKRRGSFDLTDNATKNDLTNMLAFSIAAVEMGRKFLERYQPEAVVISDRGYSPFGETMYLSIAIGIPVFTWNIGHRNNLIVMKRFAAHNADVHQFSLSAPSWERLRKLEWTEELQADTKREVINSYTSGEWYSEVGTQFHVSSYSREEIFLRLGLDPQKKTVVLFPHIFWDGTFFWGEDLFDNYEKWYCEVLKIARDKPELNWIVKIHPANAVKDVRDNFTQEHSEVTALKHVIGEIPKHIHLIEASSDISTLSLFSIMDYCLTVRGTVGIEAALWGVPVLTAGTGRYDRLGFTLDFDSKEAYLAQLARLETLPPLTPEQTDLAQRYAYGTFILKPAHITSMLFAFQQDAVASLRTNFKVRNSAELRESEDVKKLGSWIVTNEDDYCNWELIENSGS